jgi:alkylhydroperoxidase family enzyme
VALAFGGLQRSAWAAAPGPLLALVDLRIGQLLGDVTVRRNGAGDRAPVPLDDEAQLSRWPTSPLFSPVDRACLGFTEQFVIDVAGVTGALRADVAERMGPGPMLEFVVALFALDYGRRVRMALDRLFPDGPDRSGAQLDTGPPPTGDGPLLDQLDRLSRSVARLDGIDAVTTELVRLRGARQHNCRLCQSTRSLRAIEAGADEELFDTTERYEGSSLAEDQKVALRLTDAVITQPGDLDRPLVTQVHQWFTAAQVVELVMDVMRNSAQKIAVSLAADDPHVASGFELYQLNEDGEVEYLP